LDLRPRPGINFRHLNEANEKNRNTTRFSWKRTFFTCHMSRSRVITSYVGVAGNRKGKTGRSHLAQWRKRPKYSPFGLRILNKASLCFQAQVGLWIFRDVTYGWTTFTLCMRGGEWCNLTMPKGESPLLQMIWLYEGLGSWWAF